MQRQYQSCCMGHTIMDTLIALLAILATAFAVQAPFPHGKIVTYKYHADVKAGIIDPAPFASDFNIECLLQVHHDVTNPNSKNTFYVTLSDMKHGLYNGPMKHYESVSHMLPIDAAKALLNPFLVIYEENGHLEGVKFAEDEPGWSKNVKKGIVSMLQLDLDQMHVQSPIKAHSFISQEVTIHGNCEVAYNVQPMDEMQATSGKELVVTKFYESMNCSHFKYHEFNHVECHKCQIHERNDMSTASRRVFVIDNHDNEILIKKLIGHAVINYFPWLAASEAHYLLTNQTLFLEKVVPVSDIQLMGFKHLIVSPIEKVIYDEPKTPYVPEADIDVTGHRHVVKLDELVVKMKKMLDEVAGYLKETHVDKKQIDWKHDQTINRILHVMSYMNVASLNKVFSEIEDIKDAKVEAVRNIFLTMVSHVGTPAACLFTRNVVRTKSVPNWVAVTMLANLPMHVKVSSKELLLQMEELLNLGEFVSPSVREAGIFCFATLIHKTFKKEQTEVVDPLIERYLRHFMDHVRNEPMFHMKMVYMMAMKNVRSKHVLKHLEPIIKGEEIVSEKPHNIRVQAIWILKNINVHSNYIHDILWPVLSDVSLPSAVRIAAFNVLMHQVNQEPNLGRVMNIYWLMVYEKDEHLYNYYVDTVKGLANSVDPCLMKIREMAKKILKFIRIRNLNQPLSSKIHVDYVDEKYGFSESVMASLVLDNLTGLPYVGSVEHVETVAHKPVTTLGVHWNIDGMSKILKHINHNVLHKIVETIKNDNVKNILNRAVKDVPAIKDINVNVILTMNDNVVFILHSDESNSLKLLDKLKEWNKLVTEYLNVINWQTVLYHSHFEMHMVTDLGVPAILASKVPSLSSLRGSVEYSENKNHLILKSKLKYQQWMHGEYVMSIYNPVVDSWHSIRKTSSVDVTLPCDIAIGYNQETKSFKVSLARLPVSEFSVVGVSFHGKNYVTLTGDQHDLLKKLCSTCRHHEVITTGASLKTYESNFDSKDTGTRFSMILHCDNDTIPVSPVNQWLEVYSDKYKNTIGCSWMKPIMAVHHNIMNNIIAKQEGSCVIVYKNEPSIAYPTSMIDLTGKISFQDLDHNHEKMVLISSKRIDIRGNMNVKAASTDESVRQWDMNVNIIFSQGHFNNSMKVMITRTAPEEKNLKICIEAQKDYPMIGWKVGAWKVNEEKEINSKVTITMGQTKDDKCVRDDMDVTIAVKGEMSEDQKDHIVHDSMHSVCSKQSQNSLFYSKGSTVPKTRECIEEALRHSTLRKYTVNMTIRKVPLYLTSIVNMAQDILRATYFSHMKYTWNHVDPGNAKIVLEFPYSTSLLNIAAATPMYSYELVHLPFGDPLWSPWMDNAQFSFLMLHNYVKGGLKFCTIRPRVLVTLDNGIIPYIVRDKWTLLSGDHIDQMYSIFVKSVQDNVLALKVYIGEHELEIMPVDGGMTVTIDNEVIDKTNIEKGVMIPKNSDSYVIRLTKGYEIMTIESQLLPFQIYYLPDSVTIFMGTSLQGQITGMCGHMDSTHVIKIPQIYSVSHL